MEFNIKFAAYNAVIDSALDKYFSAKKIRPKLREAMHYSLFGGGKRFRPTLLLAVVDMFKKSNKDAVALASAIEMIHTYSLIHDDLPSMDNDEMRRGKPTCHRKFGEATAILAGDALHNCAFEIMIDEISKCDDIAAYSKAMSIIARASGAEKMLSGQVADLQNENNPNMSATELEYIHKNKTGALICASVLAGAYLCTDDEGALNDLALYGEQLGMTFQIADDILDVTGNPAIMGKSAGKDEAANKLTFVKIYGIEGARDMAFDCANKAVKALARFDDDALFLCDMAHFVVNRTK